MPPPKLPSRKKATVLLNGMKNNKGCCKSCLKGCLNYTVLFLLVSVYAIIGAYALINIESDAEKERINMKKMASENIQSSRDYIVEHAWYHSAQPHSEAEFKKLVTGNLRVYHTYIVESAKNSYYDGKPNDWNHDWTFSKSLLFTVTTMGAIGYGHITPKTLSGQFFTIYYGMIGIPLLLLFLAIIGDFLADSFKYIYSRLCCRWCRIRRVFSEKKKKTQLKPKVLWKETVGNEPYMPTNQANVPIVINLCVIFVYLMMGGVLFKYWEGWEMHEAIYFTFITLSTIGFGDYVPGNSFTTTGDQAFISSMKMIVTIAFCLFGMALISMAISLMQEQLIVKCKWFASELGVNSDADEKKSKITVRKHDPGTVQETLPDRDGNKTVTLLSTEDDNDSKNVSFA